MNRKQTFEKGAKAILDAAAEAILDRAGVLPSERYNEMRELARRDAAAALAVFEEAHAPTCAPMCDRPCSPACAERHALTGDEREALRDELAHWPIGSGYYQTSVGLDEAAEMADAVLAAGFRRTVQGENEGTGA